ncbi:OsmC family protein [Roseisolibacter sp. H3M3-2]|uniref:OsmC family protein n=1 Tax=Roseisolibacter sp. H3M3-2 TaxID=3031323 RepID=UPI0023DBF703|nr:OsmC family protein [Roseisolibacter sp. H3M3-2]MDF1503120.1 OsmC family protein [Roseisolibacter sp. H3M3-2]
MAETQQQATTAPAGKPPTRVQVTWQGDHRFDAVRASGGPPIRIDASAETGPGPVDTLVSALAACTAVDVVDILAKRRTPVESLVVDAEAQRFAGVPARLTAVELVYRMRGPGIEPAHAERAIELAVTKYCSVRDSLDPSIPVTWRLELDGGEA